MPTSLAIEGKRLSKERNIAEALNHFVSVGPKLADQIEQNSNTEKVCRCSRALVQHEKAATFLTY